MENARSFFLTGRSENRLTFGAANLAADDNYVAVAAECSLRYAR
jgi:hypothetical protein